MRPGGIGASLTASTDLRISDLQKQVAELQDTVMLMTKILAQQEATNKTTTQELAFLRRGIEEGL